MSIFNRLRQPKVLLVRWGIRGTRLLIISIILCILIVVFTFLMVTGLHSNNWETLQEISAVNYHSMKYCNKPGNVYGDEGELKFIKGAKRSYKLQQIHIIIRHGDRAPIILDTLPNSKPVEISCLFNKSWSFYEDLKLIKRGKDAFQVTGSKTFPIIEEREVCVGGQLTPIGHSQHLNNGRFFKKRYGDFIANIKSSSNIQVMSTGYSRTVQSAAAFLQGMFGDHFSGSKININVENDKYRETHFLQNESGEHIFCPALVYKLKNILKTESLVFLQKNSIKHIKEEYAKLFDAHIGKIASLDRLIDILYVNLCHGRDLPFGPRGKVSYKLASESFGTANQYITFKHSKMAELQTLAILSKIVQKMSHLIDECNENKPISNRIVLFSGHDTVLSPLLSLLDIHDWRWPPYASRMVLELWKDSEETVKATHENNLLSKFDNYYVRVLYNGKALTKDTKFCKGYLVDNQLCPVSLFVRYVTDDEYDGKNYYERIQNLCIGTETE